MKKYQSVSFYWLLMLLALPFSTSAQDDLYYDPSRQSGSYRTEYYRADETNDRDGGNVSARSTNDVYDDDSYDYEDDNYYEYSSRIRRFHRDRDLYWDYYDPFFVDAWLYDPWLTPGASIYVMAYDDYWRWRRWDRFNRWNRWNSWAGWGPYWGYQSWYGWNTGWGFGWYNGWNGGWGNTYVFNNYYFDPYWTWNGYNPYYCPNTVVVNNFYPNDNGWNGNPGGGFTPNTYVGPRRGGTVVNPGKSEPRTGRVTKSDMEPQVERQNPRTGTGRAPLAENETQRAKDRDKENSSTALPNTPSTSTPSRKPKAADADVNSNNSGVERTPTTRENNTIKPQRGNAPTDQSGERPTEAPVRRPRIDRDAPQRDNGNEERTRGERNERTNTMERPTEAPVRRSRIDRDAPQRDHGSEDRAHEDRTRSERSRQEVRNAPEPTRPQRNNETIERRQESRPSSRSESRSEYSAPHQERMESRPSRSESNSGRSNEMTPSRSSGSGSESRGSGSGRVRGN